MNLNLGHAAPAGGALLDVGAGEMGISLTRLESFLRQLSHDVRNDLNAMELLISLVEDGHSQSDVRSALSQLHEAVRYGARRMLRVSRAVQLPDLECIPYPVGILAEDLKERLQLERPDLSMRLQWQLPVEGACAPVDATLILEAMTELLDNACGFSPMETSVRCSVESIEDGVRWCIEQEAPSAPLLCEQWGVRPLVSSRRGHYGLGLFRVRRILQAHRASLTFRHDPEAQKLVTEVYFSGGNV